MPNSAAPPGPMGKWVRILEAFTEQTEWGVRDLARHVDIPRSAVHRILHGMDELGLLTLNGTGRFRPGPALIRLVTVLYHRLDLPRVARPILRATMEECQETVILTLYDPDRRQFIAVDAVESNQAVRYQWEALRQWSHLHLGSSGKCILAFLPDDERERILAGLPDPVPGLKPITKAELAGQLRQVRERGYVVSRSERYAGAMGAAAPVFDASGRVLGGIILTAPESRMSQKDDEHWGDIVRRAAARISAALGGTPPATSPGR